MTAEGSNVRLIRQISWANEGYCTTMYYTNVLVIGLYDVRTVHSDVPFNLVNRVKLDLKKEYKEFLIN